ncbi:MAG: peptidoglycan DD-metalloendopeptidase family protein [Desulfopila sp.]|nr:peptidoglycan DD-metalloendopeptidase family protein [Desulfopila sp.]
MVLHGQSEDREQWRLEEKQRLEREIEQNQIKIQRLNSGLEDQQEGIVKATLQEKGILAELEEIDQRLLKMAERLDDLENRMVMQQQLISTQEKELAAVRERREKVQLHMQKRIEAYYKLGKIDLVNITFSTKSFSELLRFHDAFQEVIDYDQQLMIQYHNIIKDLEKTKETLTLEEGLLEELILLAGEKEKQIIETRQEKAAVLNRIRTQAALHEQAILEIEQAKEDLSAALKAMQKKEQLFEQGFLLNKSSHIVPMAGAVTSLFNQERVNQFGIKRKTPGIAINAPDGTKIHAIYDGTVIYAGYLKGYGNTIIIDHGYRYFTITSRIERMLVSKGANVTRNDIIGIMGSTATILDDGLYFEIRHEDTPLDPLLWLDTKKLTFSEKHQGGNQS